jgi:hypothetical protein
MAKKLKINEAAALHFAAGAIDSQEVPIGRHELTGHRVVIGFADGSAVERGVGSEGDGFDSYAAKSQLTLAASLLFLDRASPDMTAGARTKLWAQCIQAGLDKTTKIEDLIPREASDALEQMKARMQADCTARRKTPAKRLGMDLVQVRVEKI